MAKITHLLALLALAACRPEAPAFDPDQYPATTIGVLLAREAPGTNFYDLTRGELARIQSRNPQLKLIIEHADGSGPRQQDQIRQAINQGARALIINLADFGTEAATALVQQVCATHVPAVYLDLTPGDRNLASCPSAYFVGTDNVRVASAQAMQILQGYNGGNLDGNGDGQVQFALIEGLPGTEILNDRSSWVVRTIENYPGQGKKSEEIFRAPAHNEEKRAYELVQHWLREEAFARVEVIIANNDAMALGAKRALEEHNAPVAVFGIDGTERGRATLNGTTSAGIDEVMRVALRLASNLATGQEPAAHIDVALENKVIKIAPQDGKPEAGLPSPQP